MEFRTDGSRWKGYISLLHGSLYLTGGKHRFHYGRGYS